MIIWDNKKPDDPKQNIRINGKHILDIKWNYIQYSELSNADLAQEIKDDADQKLERTDYHIFAHIFTKDPVDYVLNLRPIASGDPDPIWWEKEI